MADRPHVTSSGDIDLGRGLVIPARELHVRATTSGGPGGQHANRSESRIVITFDIAHSDALDDRSRERLLDQIGPSVTSASSTSRSQYENRHLALDRLARKLHAALAVAPARRRTRPTKSSVERRISEKRHRSQTKSNRRIADDD